MRRGQYDRDPNEGPALRHVGRYGQVLYELYAVQGQPRRNPSHGPAVTKLSGARVEEEFMEKGRYLNALRGPAKVTTRTLATHDEVYRTEEFYNVTGGSVDEGRPVSTGPSMIQYLRNGQIVRMVFDDDASTGSLRKIQSMPDTVKDFVRSRRRLFLFVWMELMGETRITPEIINFIMHYMFPWVTAAGFQWSHPSNQYIRHPSVI